jgi:release factor glutamine methyltransferase
LISAGEALRRGSTALCESSESARADALLLLSRALGRKREWILAHDEAVLSQPKKAEFDELCERRRSGEPIAYLLGFAGFYGREFAVNEAVLIPRPETEHLVEEAIRFIRAQGDSGRCALDVGTGSGTIACTIAAETNANVDGTDTSREAIATASDNARRLAVGDRCRFYWGDLTAPVHGHRYDVVVANLPYVPTANVPQRPESASFEPREALDGGPDGLAIYRRLLPQLPLLLEPDSLVLLEAAPPTIETLANLLRATLPNFTISVGVDYAGLKRYVRASP